MAGMLQIGRSQRDQAMAGLGSWANMEAQRNSINSQLEAQKKAAAAQTMGTMGGYGAMYGMKAGPEAARWLATARGQGTVDGMGAMDALKANLPWTQEAKMAGDAKSAYDAAQAAKAGQTAAQAGQTAASAAQAGQTAAETGQIVEGLSGALETAGAVGEAAATTTAATTAGGTAAGAAGAATGSMGTLASLSAAMPYAGIAIALGGLLGKLFD